MRRLVMSSILTKKSQITIPKKIREFLGLKPGERVAFIIEKLWENKTFFATLQRTMKKKLIEF